jgi:hypothetical protein
MKMRRGLPMRRMICFAASLLFFSCLERDPLQPEKPWVNQQQPNLRLVNDSLYTSLPCYVNFLFQAVDKSGHGVPLLLLRDFRLYEDNLPLSASESVTKLYKKNTLDYHIQTVLMLDNSASVEANLPSIKSAAKVLLRLIDKNQEIAIYSFSEKVVLMQDFTQDTTFLTKAVDGIKTGQMSTDLYGAIITGTGRWQEEYNDKTVVDGFLVLLTDGADTQSRYTLGQALSYRGKKKVLAVGVGKELDTDALSKIANQGFAHLDRYEDLPTKFKEFQTFIVDWANSFYKIRYISPKRGDHDHMLKLLLWNYGSTAPVDSLSIPYNSVNFISGF